MVLYRFVPKPNSIKINAFRIRSSRISGQVPDDVLIANPFEPMKLGNMAASDDPLNGPISGEVDDAQNEQVGEADVAGRQARRRTPKSGALACMAVGAMTASSPATFGAVYPADSSSSGWSSVREIVRMRHQGRLFPHESLDEDGEEYVPFR